MQALDEVKSLTAERDFGANMAQTNAEIHYVVKAVRFPPIPFIPRQPLATSVTDPPVPAISPALEVTYTNKRETLRRMGCTGEELRERVAYHTTNRMHIIPMMFTHGLH